MRSLGFSVALLGMLASSCGGDDGGACPAGRTRCGDRCVDTSSDDLACGGCGLACTGGPCIGGRCTIAPCPDGTRPYGDMCVPACAPDERECGPGCCRPEDASAGDAGGDAGGVDAGDAGRRGDGGGASIGEECLEDAECESGLCYGEADAEGAFAMGTCQADCLPLMDRGHWCADDGHCCSGSCCVGCGEREGLCISP